MKKKTGEPEKTRNDKKRKKMFDPLFPATYIDFRSDFAFKRLFGTEANKELLLSFLNALLDGEEDFREITYLNTEQQGRYREERKAMFDVYCKNEKDEYIIVEMQVHSQEHYRERSLFYATFPIREQAEKGFGWNYRLRKVYIISFLDFVLEDSEPERYRRDVKLCDVRTGKEFSDKLHFIYLEIPKFPQTLTGKDSFLEKWLYAMRNMNSLERPPEGMEEQVFSRFFEAAEFRRLSRSEASDYEVELDAQWSQGASLETAEHNGLRKGLRKGKQQGLKEGRQQGLKEGLEQGKAEGLKEGLEQGKAEGLIEGREAGEKAKAREIARNLLAQGMDPEAVKAMTGIG